MTLRDATALGAATQALDAPAVPSLQLDEEAFRGFYDRTARMLWAYLRRLTGDRQLADDLLQETYYRFLRAAAPLEDDTHRRRYLFRVATNLAKDFRRRQATHPAPSQQAETGDAAAPPEDVLHRIDLARALDRLRPRDRAMLWLAYAQGASHHEIADVMGIGAPSVKTLLFRARQRLAALLGRTRSGR